MEEASRLSQRGYSCWDIANYAISQRLNHFAFNKPFSGHHKEAREGRFWNSSSILIRVGTNAVTLKNGWSFITLFVSCDVAHGTGAILIRNISSFLLLVVIDWIGSYALFEAEENSSRVDWVTDCTAESSFLLFENNSAFPLVVVVIFRTCGWSGAALLRSQ